MTDSLHLLSRFIDDPTEEEYGAVLWNRSLTVASLCNILFLIVDIVIPNKNYRSINFENNQPGSAFWDWIRRHQVWLTTIYAVACATRAIWPRHDGDRYCFYDHWISVVVIGRSLATIAEVCFMAQCCLPLVIMTGKTGIANGLVAANCVAQCFCWFTVLTKNNIGHSIEESIWTVSVFILLKECYAHTNRAEQTDNAHDDKNDYDKYTSSVSSSSSSSFSSSSTTRTSTIRHNRSLSPALSTYKQGMYVFGPLYIIFMCCVDVPMYVTRFLDDSAKGTVYTSIYTGAQEILQCAHVTKSTSYWKIEMPWFSLYFTFAVWVSLYLAYSDMNASENNEGVVPEEASEKISNKKSDLLDLAKEDDAKEERQPQKDKKVIRTKKMSKGGRSDFSTAVENPTAAAAALTPPQARRRKSTSTTA